MPAAQLCALQLDLAWEDRAANHRKVAALLAEAPPTPGSLVALPEMFATGVSMNLTATQQGPGRADEAFLAGLARQYHLTLAGGVISPGEGDRARNQVVAFSPQGQLLARYTKIHPFSPGGETAVHEPGATIVTFPWAGFTVAPFLCYDLRFPELFRTAAHRGADLFLIHACWPARRLPHWLTLLQARAIENQAYVLGINRLGREPENLYAGRSILVDPHGQILADAGEEETVLSASIDPAVAADWRRDFPALRDARDQA